MLKICGIKPIYGPNIFHNKPVLTMELDLGDLVDKTSQDLEGFNDRLLDLLPNLFEHTCSPGYRGGFVERLRSGTYMGHIVEHVCLELSDLAGMAVTYGKTVSTSHPQVYKVVVRFENESAMTFLLRQAVQLVQAMVDQKPFPLSTAIDDARALIRDSQPGPSTKAIIKALNERNIPWRRLGNGSLLQLGYGKHRRFLQAAVSDRTSLIAADIASDKELTKKLLREVLLPVPEGRVVHSEGEAVDALQSLGAPVVVKPLDGHHGQGVSINLSKITEVKEAFHIAREFSKAVLVEELFVGRDYRVLVVNGKVAAASERVAAHVVGDGIHTIAQLIDLVNQDPRRGDGHENILTKMELDAVALANLKKSGWNKEDIPTFGVTVWLRNSANLSTGGTARDVTDHIHPDIRKICERAVAAVGLDIGGVDLVLQDIELPMKFNKGGIIEVNAGPGLRMHESPSEGKSRDVGRAIVEMVYPPTQPSRIPIISVTGTNGKTTVARMINHVLSERGYRVGLTSTGGIYIAGEEIATGDTTGPLSARTVLSDPSVDFAVFETARGGIIRGGLGYDWSDISVLTNIQPDHLGQDGLETVEDLMHVKSLVAERVKENGTLIINADDENLLKMINLPRVQKIPKKLVYYSLSRENPSVQTHLERGGTAFYISGESICEAQGVITKLLGNIHEIPLTLNGTAEFQVSNLLGALAACRAQGIENVEVMAALQTFQGHAHNGGRVNIYKMNRGYAVVDYGHNPQAVSSVLGMLKKWKFTKATAVIGLPGDRANWIIEETAVKVAEGFDSVIVKEDFDLRGRKRGEVAKIIQEKILNLQPDKSCVKILDEFEAVTHAFRRMNEDEVVVVFYDRFQNLETLLKEFRAQPVTSAPVFTSLASSLIEHRRKIVSRGPQPLHSLH